MNGTRNAHSTHGTHGTNALRTRYILDAVLTGMIIFELCYQYTGNLLHEVMGAAFGATVLAHVILSRKWIGVTTRKITDGKQLKGKHRVQTILVVTLAVLGTILATSSIAISHQLTSIDGFALTGIAYDIAVNIHLFATYSFALVTVVHLAIHWAGALAAFEIPYDPARRGAIGSAVGAVAAVSMVAIGASSAGPISRALFGNDDAGSIDGNANGGSNSGNGNDGDQILDDLYSGDDANSYDDLFSDGYPDGYSDGYSNGNGYDGYDGYYSDGYGNGYGDGYGRGGHGHGGYGYEYDDSYDGGYGYNDYYSDGYDSYSGGSGSSGNSGSSSGSTTQYCTLCRDHCPLSAPRCDRPYAAGLL